MPKIILWNVIYKGDFHELIEKVKRHIVKDKITVYYVSNWEELAKNIKESLEKEEREVILKDFLGCERYSVNMDVVICDGEFHLGPFKGKFIWVDPLENEVKITERERSFDRRIAYALTKKVFGIIVSTKPGQFSLNIAKKIKEILEGLGKEVYLFVGDEIKNLENFPFVEVWINTACPRIKDDYKEMLFFNAEDFLKFLKENISHEG